MKKVTFLPCLLFFTYGLFFGCQKETFLIGDFDGSIMETNPGISLTFDDNYFNDWNKMLPILKEYGAKATFFISSIDPNDTLQQSLILNIVSEGHEIGCHTMHHVDVVKYLETHTTEEFLKNEIIPVLQYFRNLSIPCYSFAYPYNSRNSKTDSILLRYFKKLRCTSKDSDDAFLLHSNQFIVKGMCIDNSSDIKINNIDGLITKIEKRQSVLITISHKISYDIGRYTTSPVLIDSLCAKSSREKLKFYTISEIY